MEQHPVPQNVTTFQFRLVGDMTIKQFGYLAGGIIVAYACYKLPLPFFFTWPLAITVGLLGFGLAFVPIEERPMDVWIVSFFKTIYNPTQYIWQRSAPRQPKQASQSAARPDIAEALAATKPQLNTGVKPKEDQPQRVPTPQARAQVATPQHTQPPAQKQDGASQSNPAPDLHGRVVELHGQLAQALAQREQLEKELAAMRQKLERQTQTPSHLPTKRAVVAPDQASPSTTIRILAPDAATRIGLPKLTSFPNVVTGIVKNQYGDLLPGVLITVRDHDDVPLRALKTNRLGQFAASTPLSSGTYTVEIEDPKNELVFDKIQISLSGTIAPLLEVVAKNQKQVERDKLAKEVFGQL